MTLLILCILFLVYGVIGLVLYGAYPHMWQAGKVTFAIFFPLHWVVLGFITSCIKHTGPFEENPACRLIAVILLFGFIFLWIVVCST